MDYSSEKNLNNMQEVNLLDLIAQLLYKWKWILLVMVIGVGVALGFWLHTSNNAQGKKITSEQVDLIKAGLSDEKIEHAEYIHAQWLSYKQYRNSLQTYLADSLYSDEEYLNNIGFTALYFVKSTISNVNQVFTRLALGENEFGQIAEILGKDTIQYDDIYRRVSIGDISVNLNDNMNINISNDEGHKQKENLLQVYLVMENRDQIEAVMDVIDRSFGNYIEVLRQADPEIEITKIGSTYSSNITGFMTSRQNNVVSYLNTVNDQINNLQVNYIDKMDPDEKEYYSILKERSEQEVTPVKQPSLLKYIIVGAFLGFVLTVCCLALKYIFDGVVKTENELPMIYQIDSANMIYRKKGSYNVFGRLARSLREIDLSDISTQMSLTACDIGIKLDKMGCSSAYLICDEDIEWDKNVCTDLKKTLFNRKASIDLKTGNPLSNSNELEAFSNVQATLIMIHLKKTRRNELRKWVQLCRRYNLSVIGAVVLEEC